MRIINEPTAAALAYGVDKEDVQNVLVWDLGGGTFDVSILELGDGVFEVRATCGDSKLGGDDWDNRLVDWLIEEFQKESGVSLRRDRAAVQRLKDAAEKAKIELSGVLQTNINLPFLSSTPDGPLHLDITLTRPQMERLSEDLLNRPDSADQTGVERRQNVGERSGFGIAGRRQHANARRAGTGSQNIGQRAVSGFES